MESLAALKADMTTWRRYLHAYPETAFQEIKTTHYIIDKLKSFGIEDIYTNFAPTGVVAIIRGNQNGRFIGLRADIDALDIVEENDIEYRSKNLGKMHACGHDGHTAILLGTAKYLAQRRNFAGNVVVIFQPAEENEGGAKIMVENGLFEKIPIDAVYAIHNLPNGKLGYIYIDHGAIRACYDVFEIKIEGLGAHAAAPHLGKDAIVTALQLVNALQTIVSRNNDPLSSLVVSVTQIHSGDTWNVLPQHATICGTVRSFDPKAQEMAEKRIKAIAKGIAAAFNVTIRVDYQRRYPATINHDNNVDIAIRAAVETVGYDHLILDSARSMGSEDFAFMLQKVPGAYVLIGAGESANLHHPNYDFNDEILTLGVKYFVEIVEQELGKST